MRVASVTFALLVLSGCAGEADYTLAGAFTVDRSDADIADFQTHVERHGGTSVLMESFPEQFRVSGLDASSCAALRAELSALAYIGSVTECQGS